MAVPEWWHWRAEARAGRAVVFDMDGVLSDAAGRQHYLESDARKDWKAFFESCGDDPLVDELHRLLELLEPTLAVVLLTARPLRVRPQTLAWLDRYQVRWDLLIMRPDRDHRGSAVFKSDAVGELRTEGFEPLLAFEDDRRNVAMFREQQIPCVYIHSGYYE